MDLPVALMKRRESWAGKREGYRGTQSEKKKKSLGSNVGRYFAGHRPPGYFWAIRVKIRASIAGPRKFLSKLSAEPLRREDVRKSNFSPLDRWSTQRERIQGQSKRGIDPPRVLRPLYTKSLTTLLSLEFECFREDQTWDRDDAGDPQACVAGNGMARDWLLRRHFAIPCAHITIGQAEKTQPLFNIVNIRSSGRKALANWRLCSRHQGRLGRLLDLLRSHPEKKTRS